MKTTEDGTVTPIEQRNHYRSVARKAGHTAMVCYMVGGAFVGGFSISGVVATMNGVQAHSDRQSARLLHDAGNEQRANEFTQDADNEAGLAKRLGLIAGGSLIVTLVSNNVSGRAAKRQDEALDQAFAVPVPPAAAPPQP